MSDGIPVKAIAMKKIIEVKKAVSEFLEILDPRADALFNVETYTDIPTGGDKPKPDPLLLRKSGLTRKNLLELIPMLVEKNDAGAGVFISVNEMAGHRSKDNTALIRGVHADLDSGKPEDLKRLESRLTPTAVVESSSGRYQVYYLIDAGELSPSDAVGINKHFVAKYGADKAATDISRLLRLPGFRHMKNRESGITPVVTLVGTGPNYSSDDLLSAFEVVKVASGSTAGDKTPISDFEQDLVNKVVQRVSNNEPDIWNDYPREADKSTIDYKLACSIASVVRSYGVAQCDAKVYVEEVFNRSGLAEREKWLSRPDYRDSTCEKATLAAYSTPALSLVAADIAHLGLIDRIKNLDLIAQDDLSTVLLQNPTQDSVALVFRQTMHGKLLFAHKLDKWYEWDGQRWRPQETNFAFDFARRLSRKLNREGKGHIASASFASGVESFCRSDNSGLAITGDEFDQNNYLLNTPAGVYDLKANILRQSSPVDYLTKITAVAPDSAGGEVFLRFLHEITDGNNELSEFLQVTLGACLSGAVESHWMMFWTGPGRNGKNTLGDLVSYVMGDYAKKISSGVLMAKQHSEHPTEIAQLKGVRLATASEVSDGDHWHESKINELTGDAMLSARVMRGDYFEFPRTHKHLIYGNHRPQLRSITEALKSRIKIVPFGVSFIGREDPALPEKLKAEAGFVLHWLIEGHKKWLDGDRKLPSCAAVEAESKDYFDAQSTVDMWIAECTRAVNNDGAPVSSLPKSSALYGNYLQWKIDRGEQPISQTRWAESMKGRYRKVISNGVRYFGIELVVSVFIQTS